MKDMFRESMRWLHTWSGLVLGWVLFFMFITGTVGYFSYEIDRWMQPEAPYASNTSDQVHLLSLAKQRLDLVAPDAIYSSVNFPVDRYSFLRINWENPSNKITGEKGERGREILNPQTGEPVVVRKTGGGTLLYRMHYALHYMPRIVAYWITSLCAMFMFIALITGIVIHIRIFKDFFTFQPNKQQRSWLDMHNLMSVLPLPFHLMITYSGLIFLMFTTMPGILTASYGDDDDAFFDSAFPLTTQQEASGVYAQSIDLSTVLVSAQQHFNQSQVRYIRIQNQNDTHAQVEVAPRGFDGLSRANTLVYQGVSGELLSTPNSKNDQSESGSAFVSLYDALLNLHEGLFAPTILRWIYFLSGLAGAGMIATGMILWASKRRKKAQKSGQVSKGLVLVEHLNVGTIVGLPIAIAAYFWANRLIPIHLVGRENWEINTLFIVWAIMPVYSFLFAKKRPLSKVWAEQLALAALMYLCLPLLNLLTTSQHLGISFVQGDWIMAGFDLTMIVLGTLFAIAAFKMHRQQAQALSPTKNSAIKPALKI
ncbi:MAG: PepSY-associated TM helix domain-containing protein [Paraglaciecola sp.]|uniref:PepSY-associated TM helix domain-containing protein n=1 Tax=Paraglaciecola sp. TaxID=1920173 RepID=UPI00329693A0